LPRQPETPRLQSAFEIFIHVGTPGGSPSAETLDRVSNLDAGERETIVLAVDRKSLLIIDDFAGRRAARELGVPFTGTAGVIAVAKEAGLISAVRPVLETIRANGYWLSDAVIDTASKFAGEQ
jgi:predicted nucleic acid-binding protein